MSYLKNIISRHISIENQVTPRAMGRFETPGFSTNRFPGFSQMKGSIVDSENFENSDPGLTASAEKTTENSMISPTQNEGHIIADKYPSRGEISLQEKINKPIYEPDIRFPGIIQPGNDEVDAVKTDVKMNVKPLLKETPNVNSKDTNKKGIFETGKALEVNSQNDTGTPARQKAVQLINKSPEQVAPLTSEYPEKEGRFISGDGISFIEKPWMMDFRKMFQNQKQTEKDSHSQQGNVIRVDIGRIDIRAVNQTIPHKTATEAKPAMSLADFLKKKNGNS